MKTGGHVVRRAFRSLWENLYLNAMATGVIAASLLLVGMFLTVRHNVVSIVDSWDRDVHLSAYFGPDVSESRRFALRDQWGADPRVEGIRYVSEADAREWLIDRVDGMDAALSELDGAALPASLEITLSEQAGHPEGIQQMAQDISAPEFTDVDFGQEWVERFSAFLSLLELLGAVLGLLILVAALFLTANTVNLVVYSRREELEVQKLVGATAGFITGPFLIEGALQGLAGGLLSGVGVFAVHRLLVVRLQDALHLGVVGEIQGLPPSQYLLLCVAGMALGVVAAFVSVRRFLSACP